jgi:hypothetical protein
MRPSASYSTTRARSMSKEYAYRATFYGYIGVLAILLYLALHG